MLYLIEEYIAQFPYRQTSDILRFKDCSEYLHEMTLDEVNKAVSTWTPASPRAVDKTKRQIAQYLEWVADQEQRLAFDLSEVNFPTKELDDAVIFSTSDIRKYYNILFSAIERKAAMNGTGGSTQIFRMTQAAGILAFYGLSDEEILNLDLSDVQPDGVRGYDLPLTQEDINVLLDYKNMRSYDANHALKGDSYIRSASGRSTDSYFLNRPLSKLDLEDKYAYLKGLLKTSQLSLYGKFNQVYKKEIEFGELIAVGKTTPDWFKNIFNVGETWLAKRRKEYIAYRELRDEYESFINSRNDEIRKQIDAINAQIAKLNKEAEELRKQLV